MSYITNIFEETEHNHYFRKVLFTGEKSQLVVMSLKKGEVINKEKHDFVEQIIFLLKGTCLASLDDKEMTMSKGDVIVVSPRTWHEVKNVGEGEALLYTVYSPANHIDGRVHKTKEEALADDEDEEFGEKPR
jgi:mannose-6-phosphate isomerase-like protein (cupin superfamily)